MTLAWFFVVIFLAIMLSVFSKFKMCCYYYLLVAFICSSGYVSRQLQLILIVLNSTWAAVKLYPFEQIFFLNGIFEFHDHIWNHHEKCTQVFKVQTCVVLVCLFKKYSLNFQKFERAEILLLSKTNARLPRVNILSSFLQGLRANAPRQAGDPYQSRMRARRTSSLSEKPNIL